MGNPSRDQVDPTPSIGRWLTCAALALAVPLGLAIAQPLADPARELRAISGGLVWAGMAGAAIGGLAIGLLTRSGRAGFRRAAALGAILALLVGGGAIGWGATAGALTGIDGCSSLPTADAGRLTAQALVDDRQVGAIGDTTSDGAAIVDVLRQLRGAPFEEHGVERVGGVDARRCSVLVSGSHALAAMPPLRTLSGDGQRPLAALPVWRGELEWWNSADGRLVMARVRVGGHPADAWGGRGLRGVISAEFRPLTAIAR